MFNAKDMFFSVEKLEARTRELENYRFIDLATIAPMTSMEGQLGVDEVYHGMPERVEGPDLCIGDEFTGRDRYLWAQKTVSLPGHREGCEV